jgi:hypothetical protein
MQRRGYLRSHTKYMIWKRYGMTKSNLFLAVLETFTCCVDLVLNSGGIRSLETMLAPVGPGNPSGESAGVRPSPEVIITL